MRLLILSCSATKRPNTSGRTAAANLYAGPVYLDVRKILAETGTLDCSVLILSAEHGLIGSGKWLEEYDTRMTPARARAMAETNVRILQTLNDECGFTEVFILAGKDYMPALGRIEDWAGAAAVTVAGGRGIGDMRSQLASWVRAGIAAADADAEASYEADLAAIECRACGGDCFCDSHILTADDFPADLYGTDADVDAEAAGDVIYLVAAFEAAQLGLDFDAA